MNEQRLREAVQFIGQDPLKLDMSIFRCRANMRMDRHLYPVTPRCNTVMCIAGAVVEREAIRLQIPYQHLVANRLDSEVASVLLNIDEETGKKLFYLTYWPTQFATDYVSFTDELQQESNPDVARQIAQVRFAILKKRVEHFIATLQ